MAGQASAAGGLPGVVETQAWTLPCPGCGTAVRVELAVSPVWDVCEVRMLHDGVGTRQAVSMKVLVEAAADGGQWRVWQTVVEQGVKDLLGRTRCA